MILTELFDRLHQKLIAAGATGTAVAPTNIFGEYLVTHGVWILSYGEWLRVIAGLYVVLLVGKLLKIDKLVRCLLSKLR